MAKKVRRNPEAEEEAKFEFPEFDEAGFVSKELELTIALALACGFAVLLGLLSWFLTSILVPWWAPFLVGFAGIIVGPLAIRRLRSRSEIYTKGDWAGLIALMFFGWLALWFVLVNVV
ncbi:MAG: hypothetical protein ACLQD9_05400 [Thermoplasmata archaeon]|nr:hypothetical protein [Thermoplasmata archaeon]